MTTNRPIHLRQHFSFTTLNSNSPTNSNPPTNSTQLPLLNSGAIVPEIFVRLVAVRECVGGGVLNDVIARSCLERCGVILYELSSLAYAHPFLKPVDVETISGCADVISNPMDLSTVQDRIANEYYLKDDDSELTPYERCYEDVELIWNNCLKFNDPDSQIANDARDLREYFRERYENSISIPMQMWSDRHLNEDAILSKRMSVFERGVRARSARISIMSLSLSRHTK